MLVGIAAKYDTLNFRLRSCAQDELVLIIAENSRGDSPVDLAERCEMLPAVIDLRMRRARAPLWRDDVAVLVALDSNVVDLVEVACSSSAHVDAMEAMEPPPRFENLSPQQEVEVFACYGFLRWRLPGARPSTPSRTCSTAKWRPRRVPIRCCVSPLMSSYGSGRSPSTDCPIPACDPRPPS